MKGKATGIVKGSLGLVVGLAVEKKWQRIGEGRSDIVKGKAIRVWRSSIGKATRVRYGFIYFFVFLFVVRYRVRERYSCGYGFILFFCFIIW